MSEWEFAKVKYTAPHNVPRLIEAADAAIAELEAKLADTERRFAAIVAGYAKLLDRIADLEGENERLRRVIGAAVEDSANLEAERDRAHDDAGNLEGEVNGLKAELAPLRDRRCDGCQEWSRLQMADGSPADWGKCSGTLFANGRVTSQSPADFACSRHQPREGGTA